MADLPTLTTITTSARAFARILRAALRDDTIEVPLDRAPAHGGVHLLHVVLRGEVERAVWIRAQPNGAGLRLSPRSEVQGAQLYALAQLGGPTSELPPENSDGPTMHLDQHTLTIRDDLMHASSEHPPRTQRMPFAGMPAAPAPPIDPLIDRVIGGRYRIESLLGRGGAGAVYKGTHTDLGRDVAIKLLHPTNRGDVQFVKRFEAEARAASRLEHIHVARVLDFGEEKDGLLYLVMEYIAGRSLETILASGQRLSAGRAIDIMIQVCSALARAHAEGIIHRDIKPENIMLLRQTDDDEQEPIEIVKVCDFGVAKVLTTDALQSELTIAGLLCGSPLYMSPEQITGKTVDPRCDVYSLGVTFYELTVGAPPFEAETVEQLLQMHLLAPPPPPSARVNGYDRALEAIVLRMLSKEAADRPTARALRGQLRDLAISARRAAPQSAPH